MSSCSSCYAPLPNALRKHSTSSGDAEFAVEFCSDCTKQNETFKRLALNMTINNRQQPRSGSWTPPTKPVDAANIGDNSYAPPPPPPPPSNLTMTDTMSYPDAGYNSNPPMAVVTPPYPSHTPDVVALTTFGDPPLMSMPNSTPYAYNTMGSYDSGMSSSSIGSKWLLPPGVIAAIPLQHQQFQYTVQPTHVYEQLLQDLEQSNKRNYSEFMETSFPIYDNSPNNFQGYNDTIAQMNENKKQRVFYQPSNDPYMTTNQPANSTFKTFEDRLRELKAYKGIFGNCDVPQNLGTQDQNYSLAIWVKNMRKSHGIGKLHSKRIKVLDKIGFTWITEPSIQERNFHDHVSKIQQC